MYPLHKMKTLKTVLLFLTLGLGHSQAQINLVPNPSFEDYLSCSDLTSQPYNAVGWFSGRESPDYFNICDTLNNTGSNNVGIPHNCFGFQNPFDGNAYMGIGVYSGLSNPPSDYREYICSKLTSSLNIGNKYYLSLMVSLTQGDISTVTFKYACNNIGILFTMDSLKENMPLLYPSIPNFAHLHASSIISDTMNWINVCGEFIADSAYNYINIGNFFSDTATQSINYFTTGNDNYAYYYIDNIIVTEDSIACNIVGTEGIQVSG